MKSTEGVYYCMSRFLWLFGLAETTVTCQMCEIRVVLASDTHLERAHFSKVVFLLHKTVRNTQMNFLLNTISMEAASQALCFLSQQSTYCQLYETSLPTSVLYTLLKFIFWTQVHTLLWPLSNFVSCESCFCVNRKNVTQWIPSQTCHSISLAS
jgi:hypothetical protein